MYIRVVIDMENPNALISMAQVSLNANNPYATFCEYIKYCLSVSTSGTMTEGEIIDGVSGEFGITLPHNVVRQCLIALQKDGFIKQVHGRIRCLSGYDVCNFQRRRDEFRRIEDNIVGLLLSYVERFGKKWNYKYAREQLIKVLDNGGLAYDIFASTGYRESGRISIIPDEPECASQPLFTDEFFVGRFVEEILQSDTPKREYLQRICTGLMMCAGIYQLPAQGTTVASPQIKGTEFYFDTRLLLRYLGCAGEAAVASARELVSLIQDAGGKIRYYPQTLEEMNCAFEGAVNELRHYGVVRNDEMRLFLSHIKTDRIAILSAKQATFRSELSDAQIFETPINDHGDANCAKIGFDEYDFQRYLESSGWKNPRGAENDAKSIWETHMRRGGRYTEYCGTNARLPVFVTTNSKLVGVTLAYCTDRPGWGPIQGWRANRLPVITDMKLTCRLWPPATQGERLATLYMTANAVAAQSLTPQYIARVRELMVEIHNTIPKYSTLALSEYFDDRVTNAVLDQTGGNEEKFDLGTLVNTFDEIVEEGYTERDHTIDTMSHEFSDLADKYDSQTQAIIESAVEKNENDFGIAGILLRAGLVCPGAVIVACIAVASVVSLGMTALGVSVACIVSVTLGLIQHFCGTNIPVEWFMGYYVPRAEKSIDRHITKKLTRAELPYKDVILKQVKEKSALWVKCKTLAGRKKDKS